MNLAAFVKRIRSQLCWITAAVAWGGMVVGGFGLLWSYGLTPGAVADAPTSWPADSFLRPTPGRACLILALHPRCPCSRATIDELEQITTCCGRQLDTHVLFYIPVGHDAAWAHTDLWDRAAALPGVTVWCDENGAEGRRFGALTSGHAALYSPEGGLRFHGGITRSRGESGANEGRTAIVAHVLGTTGRITPTEVFGCPLREPEVSTKPTGASECKERK